MWLLHCPISGGCDTKITKHTFIKACLKHQENMGKKVNMNSSRRRDYTGICDVCTIREAVYNGDPFEPPEHVSFIPLPTEITKVDKTEITIKAYEGLKKKNVENILILLTKGFTQKDIAVQFKVKPQLIRKKKKKYKGIYDGL